MQTTTSPPTVSLTNPPSSGAQIKGSLALSATATPATGDSISQAQLLVNGAVVQTDTSAPYNFTLNTLGYKDGSYTITVKAIDNQSLVGTSTDMITVSNGDINGDNKVSISDLSIMAAHWGSSSANASQGDLNGDGKVNISDLSILANNWQQSW